MNIVSPFEKPLFQSLSILPTKAKPLDCRNENEGKEGGKECKKIS